MAQKTVKMLPPDGGYGWVIVFAQALNNLVIIPIIQSFGLIFKDTFANLGLSATEGSLIINLNAAFGMLAGLVNGALLKFFGYRKVAIGAAIFFTIGICLTAYSTTFLHFMMSYGIVTSLGMGLGMAAYSLALNTYFKTNRNKAVGYCMTITGFGPIIMPQLITLLMKVHTVQGVTLILGGLSAHAFIGAVLLQPVKWHMKKEETVSEEEEEKLQDIKKEEQIEGSTTVLEAVKEDNNVKGVVDRPIYSRRISKLSQMSESGLLRRRKDSATTGSVWSIDHDVEVAAIYGIDSVLGESILSLTINQDPASHRNNNNNSNWKKSTVSLEKNKAIPEDSEDCERSDGVYNPDMSQPIKKKPLWKRILLSIARFADLDLLRDPIYVNIMLGMSLAVFAELNFSILTPFILADFELSTGESATFMSVLGVADICFRFLAPYIGDYLHKPPRPMYGLTLLLLIGTRFSLLISNNFYILLIVALALGIAKGIRTVYMSLVIPAHVPLEKLASASGIQMMVNGVCILIGGPLLGVVRDITGSYKWCIVIMNCVTFTTVIMWSCEFLVVRYRRKKQESEALVEQQSALILNQL